jgi:hypothetical protein
MANDRAFMSLWLAPMLAPGEEIVAEARAFSGPSLSWDLPAVLVTLLGTYAGWRDLGGHMASALFPLAGFVAGACATVISLARRPYYLVVTQRQLIVVRKRGGGALGPGLTCLPLASAVVRTGHSLYRPAVRIASDGGPISVSGKSRASLRLILTGRRARYEAVLDAMRAGGGAIDLPLTLGAMPTGTA